MSAEPKPVQKDGEENLAYNLRLAAWRRKERARKRREREMVDSPDEAEAAEPEVDDPRKDVSDAWSRSERELEKMGE